MVLVGYYLFGRYPQLVAGEASYFDAIVFLVWIGVCLAPLFQEIDLLGIKLKQQIRELKKDIEHQLSVLHTEVRSSIEVSNANSNQIFLQSVPVPPQDSEIPDLSAAIKDQLSRMGIAQAEESIDSFEVDPIHVEMFKVRLAFENLIRDFSGIDEKYRRRFSVGRMLGDLRRYDAASDGVISGVQDVIAICNYAVHGEQLTDAQIKFVRSAAPGLLRALEKELRENL